MDCWNVCIFKLSHVSRDYVDGNYYWKNSDSEAIIYIHVWIFRYQYESLTFRNIHINYLFSNSATVQFLNNSSSTRCVVISQTLISRCRWYRTNYTVERSVGIWQWQRRWRRFVEAGWSEIIMRLSEYNPYLT
jgi:hypothetical protein